VTARHADVAERLARIGALVPAGRDAKTYLQQCLDEQLGSTASDTPMGVVPASLLSATRAFASARITVELIDTPARIEERPEGVVDLGVIEWLLRPSVRILDGLIEPPAGPPWNGLSAAVVENASQAVCRLDLAYEGYEPIQVGTGFLIGKVDSGNLAIMTNAHVVHAFQRAGWPAVDGVAAVCDFARYSMDTGGELFPLKPDYRLHPQYDLALVFLQVDLQRVPPPAICLMASGRTPIPTEGLELGVIGHPSFNSAYDSFPSQFGFGDVFGVKRFSPGILRVLDQRRWLSHDVRVFLHDATTLSGSSGSCIIDLKSMNVVGLHFGGWPMPRRRIAAPRWDSVAQLFEANGAVPLWLLANDPMLLGSVSFE
jgi:hypothetical protein